MLIYLSTEPGSEAWGTDILDADLNLVATAPYKRNGGLIFVPGPDTWHGFHKRPINGVRRSLIINYVKPEWRSPPRAGLSRSPRRRAEPGDLELIDAVPHPCLRRG